jgi:hypothetical protein
MEVLVTAGYLSDWSAYQGALPKATTLQFSRPRRAQVCFENAPNLRLLVFQHSFNVFSMPELPALLSSLQYQAFISEELKFAYVAGWLRTVT